MARARGANAGLAAVFESTYGVPPASGYRKLPFVSANLGEEQSLIESDLLGFGREPQQPAYDVVNNDGDVVVPVDQRNIGFWLRGLMGPPTSAAMVAASGSIVFAGQPANNSTITLNGIAWTFVSTSPSGNESQIGANLGATLTNLVTALNASAVSQIAAATYAQTGSTTLTITHDTIGVAGNAYTLAAQATSNGTPSGATLAGGANSHTFISGAQSLPSLAIEMQLPDVPFFGMTYGARVNRFQVQAQRSGLLSATINVIAQGESIATSTQAGTPTSLALDRFSQFQGEVKRNGVALGNIVSAELAYSNNLERVEVIRSDGRIADADPGIIAATGTITTRFSDTTLVDQATNRTPCELAFGWSAGPSAALIWTLHRVFLPRGDRQIQGPGGIQIPFAFQSAKDPVLDKTATCVLTNDVASY
jgi:hypothetical protein